MTREIAEDRLVHLRVALGPFLGCSIGSLNPFFDAVDAGIISGALDNMTTTIDDLKAELVGLSSELKELANDALEKLAAVGSEAGRARPIPEKSLEELHAAVVEARGASRQTVAARVKILDGKGKEAAGGLSLKCLTFRFGREAFDARCSSLTKVAGVEFVDRKGKPPCSDRFQGLLWVLCHEFLGRAVQAKKDLFDSLLTMTEKARALRIELVVAVTKTCTDASLEEVVGKIESFLVDETRVALRKEKAALDEVRGALGQFAADVDAENYDGIARWTAPTAKQMKGRERQARHKAKKKREKR